MATADEKKPVTTGDVELAPPVRASRHAAPSCAGRAAPALTQMPQDLGNAGSEGCGMEPKLKAWEPDYGEEKTWATPESACPASWPRGPTCERALIR